MSDDLFDRIHLDYFRSGSIHYCYEVDEKNDLHGIYVFFYDRGIVKELAQYEHGEPVGVHTGWYEDGRLSSVIHHANGQFHGSYRRWYENGIVSAEANYINGVVDGIYIERYSNGIVKQTSEIVNGIDIRRAWDPRGIPTHVEHYNEHNELHGVAHYYNSDGINFRTHYWHNDVDTTDKIEAIVKDILNITDQEKTQIAVQLGFVL